MAKETYNRSGLAIINPYGGIWTDKVFDTDKEALQYLRNYWGNDKDLSEFKLAYAHVEVKLHKESTKPVFVPLPKLSHQ